MLISFVFFTACAAHGMYMAYKKVPVFSLEYWLTLAAIVAPYVLALNNK